MANPSRFSGMLGFGAKKGAAAEDDKKDDKDAKKGEKPVQKEDESDEDYRKRVKEWEDDQDSETEGAAQPAAAEASFTQADIDAAHAAGVTEGLTAERARWTTVLSSEESKGKTIAACDLLADSEMDAAAINKFLGKQPAARSTLAARNPTPTPAPATGADHEDPAKSGGAKGMASEIAAAVAKAGGLKLTGGTRKKDAA